MILLYTSLLVSLAVVKFLLDRRAARLEQRYVRAALEADRLLGQSSFKPGNSKLDAAQTAKRQYLLGQLVQKRDRLEARHELWLARAEKFGRLLAAVRDWKGKKLPYTFGLVDMSCLLGLIDYLGAGHYLNAAYLADRLMAWLAG